MIPCRDWRNAFRSDSAGKYWRWARLRVNLSKYPDQEQDLINSRIIRIVPKISIQRADHNILVWLLESIRDGETVQLKKLCISEKVLHVTPEIVAGAAMKVETLHAYVCSPELEAVLEAVLSRLAATEDSRLRGVGVRGGFIPSSFILEDSLSAGQLTALFSRICHSPDQRLTELTLYNNNISLVPPEVLVGAIQRLRVVWFVRGRMTGEQATAILIMVKERRLGRIEFIYLQKLVGMSSVSPCLLQEAKLNTNCLLWID